MTDESFCHYEDVYAFISTSFDFAGSKCTYIYIYIYGLGLLKCYLFFDQKTNFTKYYTIFAIFAFILVRFFFYQKYLL